jgi:uncharacterized protein (DUF433 family)
VSRVARVDKAPTFEGVYEPAEVARYLAVTLPGRQRPLTTRRVYRWVRSALVAPEHRTTSGWLLTLGFQDLVTCQVITLLREAGFSLHRIQKAERFFEDLLQVSKPFAVAKFWHAVPDILTQIDGHWLAGTRGGQLAFDFLAEYTKPVLSQLEFRDDTGRPFVWRPSEGISLKPEIQFGQPCIEGTRIPTSAIWGFYNAGDSVQFIADSYRIKVAEVERAVRWERKLRANFEVAAAA